MTEAAPKFIYRVATADGFEAVKPLWEKLNEYHAGLPWPFAAEARQRTFEPRKQEILAKTAAGKLRIELASTATGAVDIAYCISTVTPDGLGEVDSVFVDESCRSHGIGSELLRRALAWLDAMGAISKVVSVAHANQHALALYARFGFHPRTILLQQKSDLETSPGQTDIPTLPGEVTFTRFSNAAHREQVIALWEAVFGYEAAHNRPALVIDRKVAVADGLFFVAIGRAEVVGTVIAGYDGHRGWIYSLAVSPKHRRRGIGSGLMSFAERALIERGCVKINLQIVEGNESVSAFYAALGYCVEKRLSMGKRIGKNIPAD